MPFIQQPEPTPSDEAKIQIKSGKQPLSALTRVVDDEEGATAIEYGLVVAGIGIAILAVVFSVGEEISSLFGQIQQILAARDPGSG